jgi:PKHD-type hydroxylase
MNLHNYFYYFKSVLPNKLCDDIINFGESQNTGQAITGILQDVKNPSKKLLKKNLKQRNSTVAFLSEHWIYKEIHPYIQRANVEAGWNFEWDWSEPAQFTKYGLNQHYDWHKDSWDLPYNDVDNKNKHGKIRKLSVTCSLSDSSEYEGGELQLLRYGAEKELSMFTVPKELGLLTIFDSRIAHRVRKVKSGKRKSLVGWVVGPRWR